MGGWSGAAALQTDPSGCGVARQDVSPPPQAPRRPAAASAPCGMRDRQARPRAGAARYRRDAPPPGLPLPPLPRFRLLEPRGTTLGISCPAAASAGGGSHRDGGAGCRGPGGTGVTQPWRPHGVPPSKQSRRRGGNAGTARGRPKRRWDGSAVLVVPGAPGALPSHVPVAPRWPPPRVVTADQRSRRAPAPTGNRYIHRETGNPHTQRGIPALRSPPPTEKTNSSPARCPDGTFPVYKVPGPQGPRGGTESGVSPGAVPGGMFPAAPRPLPIPAGTGAPRPPLVAPGGGAVPGVAGAGQLVQESASGGVPGRDEPGGAQREHRRSERAKRIEGHIGNGG